MSESTEPAGMWVLSEDAVKSAVRRLIARSTHPFFLGYLHLRQVAARAGGDLTKISPAWSDLGWRLEVDGAPPERPYLKPFHTKANREDRFQWWNSNIPGSFAPSSLRAGQGPLEVVSINADGTFDLPEDHPARALKHLLAGERMKATDLAAFLLRDHGFIAADEPGTQDLIDTFRREYGVTDDDEFLTIYDPSPGSHPASAWFEPFDVSAGAPMSSEDTP